MTEPKWTKEPPDKAGYYWTRDFNFICDVFYIDPGCDSVWIGENECGLREANLEWWPVPVEKPPGADDEDEAGATSCASSDAARP